METKEHLYMLGVYMGVKLLASGMTKGRHPRQDPAQYWLYHPLLLTCSAFTLLH